ncbi:MAG: Maf family protein [Acidobacteria bacterium]|jgi:septum formation protein|nr:Maf family protein [Acidobacteriota bacterium]
MLVLASASPRRRELLAQAGFSFEVAAAQINEDPRPEESPIAYVTRLAREKAEAIAGSPKYAADESVMVLGADTTVVAPTGEILAKPLNNADAARMLRLLSGATHKVITGVALVAGDHTEVAAEVTYVTMRTLSDEEIAAYLQTGEAHDKAGSYAIQGYAARWIPRVHGCYFNVVGLPLALVTAMIEGVEAKIAQTATR